jgi:hypothetical protein
MIIVNLACSDQIDQTLYYCTSIMENYWVWKTKQ